MRKIDYPLMYRRVYSSERGARLLLLFERVAVALVVLAYLASVTDALVLLTVSAVPFVAVSIMRRLIGAKRPYEVYDLASLGITPKREGEGDSLPSRHTFSAFLIGALLLLPSPALGSAVLALGVYIAAARVLLGFHFIRDVILGAVLGAVMGAVGVLCIALF